MSRKIMLVRYTVVLTAVFFFVDRITKVALQSRLPHGFEPRGVISLVHHQNTGIIANIALPRSLIIFITILFLGVIFNLLRNSIRDGVRAPVTYLSILLAGAIGNLWDRIAQGYVFDWILLFGRSAINLADIFIVIGLIGFLFLTGTAKSWQR